MGQAIWTIGHSSQLLEAFIAWLQEFRIALGADVRSPPGSRQVPWSNKEVLLGKLAEAGIAYVHIPALGGRRRPHGNSGTTVWRHPAFRGYADFMQLDPGFENGVAELEQRAPGQRTCIMCSEALWWRCHRSLIADRLKADGWQVFHITGLGREEEHPRTVAARLKEGKLYSGPEHSSCPFAREA